jgi:hypothetical protein
VRTLLLLVTLAVMTACSKGGLPWYPNEFNEQPLRGYYLSQGHTLAEVDALVASTRRICRMGPAELAYVKTDRLEKGLWSDDLEVACPTRLRNSGVTGG